MWLVGRRGSGAGDENGLTGDPVDVWGTRRRSTRLLSLELIVLGVLLGWLVLTVSVVGAVMASGPGDAALGGLPVQETLVELEGGFTISPSELSVEPGSNLVLRVVNSDQTQHNLQVSDELGTRRLLPGETVMLPVGLLTEDTLIWCSVKGHREQGMEALITVGRGDTGGDGNKPSPAAPKAKADDGGDRAEPRPDDNTGDDNTEDDSTRNERSDDERGDDERGDDGSGQESDDDDGDSTGDEGGDDHSGDDEDSEKGDKENHEDSGEESRGSDENNDD